jgi:hypothetical protein
VSASSEDDRATPLQPHDITSDTINSVGSILKHAVLKNFAGLTACKSEHMSPLHGGHISDN